LQAEDPGRFEFSQVQMGVPWKLILYADDEQSAKAAADAAFAKVAALNTILSDYDPASELSRLSDTAGSGKWVPVSGDLWLVLCRAQELAAESEGAFDVTVGPLVRLWRRSRRQKELPSPERLAEALAAVGYKHLEVDPTKPVVRLAKSGMRLDLGGIAMGYAADEALEVLRSHGVSRAMIDASGDILLGDAPPGKEGWRIAVDPAADDDTPLGFVTLTNAAVTTSGDTFQFVEIGGKRYSHIVDPKTGLGLTDHSSVVVVAQDCITADSLDTAALVMGPEAALKLIEATHGAAAVILRTSADHRAEVHQSSRMGQLLEKAKR